MSKLEVSRRAVLRGSTALVALAMLPVKGHAADSGTTTAVANTFTAGAVYFRKSNPPSQEWDRDYASAHGIGLGILRHWFMWSAIEVAPGAYDWADYDLQLDLAAKHGLKTIISIIDNSAPEWAFETFAASRFVSNTGKVEDSTVSASSETGGSPGLCLDNDDVRDAVGRFITALIERYRNHPALLGYDVWNETSGQFGVPEDMYCFCNGTRHRLHDWRGVMAIWPASIRPTAYIAQGGTVVCEGLPAYFGDHGHVGESQPNYGLDEVFGCRQAVVEFAPDLSENLQITLDGAVVNGRYFRQDYAPTSGRARGHYADGAVAAVENRYGKGKALLVGSFLGAGYAKQDSEAMRKLYAGFSTSRRSNPVSAQVRATSRFACTKAMAIASSG